MIIFNAPMSQNQVIETLETYDQTQARFQFVKKEGIKLFFTVTDLDEEAGAKLAKEIIKATPFGQVVYFQVTVG